MRNTKIVATLGPATDSGDTLRTMLEAGVDVCRLNASHGTREEHASRIRAVRRTAKDLNCRTGILLDLQGPKIRLGTFAEGECTLIAGRSFTITTEPVTGSCERVSTTYAYLAADVKPGGRILLADGAVELRVISSDGTAARCEVVSGGTVRDRQGLNLPGAAVRAPAITGKDIADLESGLAEAVDFVALSFVRSAADVRRLRDFLEQRRAPLPVIAKIEKPEALRDLDAILKESDGVMVARGDLGVELALEKVPVVQKSILARAREQCKFSITATQMLESMIDHARPTRAEVSDVANAIYDGSDAVMLSAETSVGKFPVESVRMMARIAGETEAGLLPGGMPKFAAAPRSNAEIVAEAAYDASRQAGAAAIAVFTISGATARLVARFRPGVPVFAFTPEEAVARRLSLVYGVRPLLAPNIASTDEMLREVEERLLAHGAVHAGDSVVCVAGQPVGTVGATNMMKLHRISTGAK